jgi:hypothetical protein
MCPFGDYYGRKAALTRRPFAQDGKLLSKPYRVTLWGSSVWGWRIPFQNYFLPQRIGAITMIAISIFCVLLICLFQLDLDDTTSQG